MSTYETISIICAVISAGCAIFSFFKAKETKNNVSISGKNNSGNNINNGDNNMNLNNATINYIVKQITNDPETISKIANAIVDQKLLENNKNRPEINIVDSCSKPVDTTTHKITMELK